MYNGQKPERTDYATVMARAQKADRAMAWNTVSRACFIAGSILFIVGMLMTMAHSNAEEAFEDDLEEWEAKETVNPWDSIDEPVPIPSWFVLMGGGLAYILLWTGILLLLWAVFMKREG